MNTEQPVTIVIVRTQVIVFLHSLGTTKAVAVGFNGCYVMLGVN